MTIIKVIQKTIDSVKVLVGDELTKAQYDYNYSDIDYVVDNLDSYPELVELLSDDPEDARQELLEIIRKGLWPKLTAA